MVFVNFDSLQYNIVVMIANFCKSCRYYFTNICGWKLKISFHHLSGIRLTQSNMEISNSIYG